MVLGSGRKGAQDKEIMNDGVEGAANLHRIAREDYSV